MRTSVAGTRAVQQQFFTQGLESLAADFEPNRHPAGNEQYQCEGRANRDADSKSASGDASPGGHARCQSNDVEQRTADDISESHHEFEGERRGREEHPFLTTPRVEFIFVGDIRQDRMQADRTQNHEPGADHPLEEDQRKKKGRSVQREEFRAAGPAPTRGY